GAVSARLQPLAARQPPDGARRAGAAGESRAGGPASSADAGGGGSVGRRGDPAGIELALEDAYRGAGHEDVIVTLAPGQVEVSSREPELRPTIGLPRQDARDERGARSRAARERQARAAFPHPDADPALGIDH